MKILKVVVMITLVFCYFCYPSCPSIFNMVSCSTDFPKFCKWSSNYKIKIDEMFNKKLFSCASSCPFGYFKEYICME